MYPVSNSKQLAAEGITFTLSGAWTHGGFHDDCACGAKCKCPRDGITGAKGFYDGGESVGLRLVGKRSEFDVEAELHEARLLVEDDEESEERDDAAELLEQLDGADGDHRSLYFSASEGLADTTELCRPSMAELDESQFAELRSAVERSIPRLSDTKPMPGTYDFWQAYRYRRAVKLWRQLRRLRRAWWASGRAELAALKRDIADEYHTAWALINKRGKHEYYLLFLTGEQFRHIMAV